MLFVSVKGNNNKFLLTDVIKEHEDLLCKVLKNTENLNSKIFKTKNGRLIMQ